MVSYINPKDNENELIVGSEDFEIRVYENEEMTNEILENYKVIMLKALQRDRFA
jgi:hypothetical protein